MQLAKGTLMIPSAKSLYAIDLQTGEFRWKKENTFGYFLQLVTRDDTLFYTHVDKTASLEVASALTGALYWQVSLSEVNDYSGNGMMKDSLYYFQSANAVCSHMNAFNLNTRKLQWQTAGCITSSTYTNLVGNDIFLLHQNYLSPASSTMISINAGNGTINWNRAGAAVYVVAPNAATQTTDFVVSNLDPYTGIFSVNPATGATIWQRFLDHEIWAMTAVNGRMYFTGWDKAGTGLRRIIHREHRMETHVFNGRIAAKCLRATGCVW